MTEASAAQAMAAGGLAQIVDGTWMMPGQTPARETLAGTTAVIDTDAIKALPHDSRAQDCVTIFANSGVKADRPICVYDRQGLFSAPWIVWLLASHGAGVSLISGFGDTGEPQISDGSFTSRADPTAMNATRADVLDALGTDTQIVDARGPGRFAGTEAEPRAGSRSGHIPGSQNLHYAEIVKDGAYRELDEMSAIVRARNIDLDKPIITTCGSGVTASLLAVAFHRLGARNVRVYQGSWAEWGMDPSLPIETGAA